ncbi:hypothetical protein SAMN05421823_11025 [Catalinimonas alkaloidigena]|uniref:DUF1684 domain-containing protein n=1 Tax=Catalinimonas alkaloidigena TaxID=1075417 RepID=A0A1G9Q379_9BACT|nr:DUF1684 domain-containing protein [Catalinimonas alkaloidigena]SDM05484.1 hypothetical protein SAMN05421823_11025 [Catalinimonas alkaloidigena]
MKPKHFLLGILTIGAVLMLAMYLADLKPAAPLEAIVDAGEYAAELQKFRQEKNEYFRENQESPLASTQNFDSLPYYAADLNWRIRTLLQLTGDTALYPMAMTDGKEEKFLRYGRVDFVVNEIPLSLYLFRHKEAADEEKLFLPFTDATNGEGTYAGGRYLDVDPPESDTITIDFNLAYNPYCAYSSKYSCPVPPRENHLSVPVKAGEKDFPKDVLSTLPHAAR